MLIYNRRVEITFLKEPNKSKRNYYGSGHPDTLVEGLVNHIGVFFC